MGYPGHRDETRQAPHETQVLAVLGAASRRLRLNEIAAATDLSVGQVSLTLQSLERGGQARFVAGGWDAIRRPDRPS